MLSYFQCLTYFTTAMIPIHHMEAHALTPRLTNEVNKTLRIYECTKSDRFFFVGRISISGIFDLWRSLPFSHRQSKNPSSYKMSQQILNLRQIRILKLFVKNIRQIERS